MPWYWTHPLSLIILSYLLAFVQLTWHVDNGWFLPVLKIFFMEFINIGPAYMRRWAGGGWVVAKAKTKKQDDTNGKA